jgi:hypothetical protein
MSDFNLGSRQVCWWSVHEFVAPMLAEVGAWPMAGTPAWCELPDDHPQKVAAVYSAAQHWALRVETDQQASAEASRAVAASADWKAIAKAVHKHECAVNFGTYYVPRKPVQW